MLDSRPLPTAPSQCLPHPGHPQFLVFAGELAKPSCAASEVLVFRAPGQATGPLEPQEEQLTCSPRVGPCGSCLPLSAAPRCRSTRPSTATRCEPGGAQPRAYGMPRPLGRPPGRPEPPCGVTTKPRCSRWGWTWLYGVVPCCWRAWVGCELREGVRAALSWVCPCSKAACAHAAFSGPHSVSPSSPGYSGPAGSLGTAPEGSSAHLPPGPPPQPGAALRWQEPTPRPRRPSRLPHPPQHPQGHPARGAASPRHAGQPAGVW